MIQKTQTEKELLKAAKLASKQSEREYKEMQRLDKERALERKRMALTQIKTGIVKGEKELPLDYEVTYDLLYVAVMNDDTAKVVRSDVKGTVKRLINDLRNHFKLDVKSIYNCNLAERNIF